MMKFNSVFLVSSYSLVVLGLIGLLFTGEIAFYYLLFAAFSLILALLGEAKGRGSGFLPTPLANVFMSGIFGLTVFSIFVARAQPVQELVHFLLALQAVKLSAAKKQRDWLQLYVLSFFNVIAAAALSVELSFAVVFIAYLFAAPWVLVVFHLKYTTETAGKDPDNEKGLLVWPLFRLVGKISGLLFLLTLFFFITMPRFGGGIWGDSWASGVGMTGFSDRLSLGDVSEIKQNNAVAMRIKLQEPDQWSRGKFYWRGIVLDRFDGKKWDRSDHRLTRIRRLGDTYLVAREGQDQRPLVGQEIILEPTGTQALFALGWPVKITGRLRRLYLDGLGNLRSSYSFPFQISYVVHSNMEGSKDEKVVVDNFLQLPDLDPRIIALSRRITTGIRDPRLKAQALEAYLRNSYRYTLKGFSTEAGDPLADFLFHARQGDCEYFSTALTVMLRVSGIPARVVNGYVGGDWNPYGGYFVVRQSNAHSWVEAYIDGAGWLTLDATPPNVGPQAPSIFASMVHLIDFMRMRWYRHVVNFGFRDQFRLVSALKRPSAWLDRGRRALSLAKVREYFKFNAGRETRTLIVVVLLVLGLWLWRNRNRLMPRGTASPLAHEATKRYRLLLKLLRKRGISKRPGETPDEFGWTIGRESGRLVREFTQLYQQSRFSGRTEFAAALERMDEIVSQLAKIKKIEN